MPKRALLRQVVSRLAAPVGEDDGEPKERE